MPSNAAAPGTTEAIKQSLSAGTCSNATLSLLNDAFTSGPAVNVTKSRTKTGPARSRALSKTSSSAVSPGLIKLERYKLAIEVINSTLRCLSSVGKSGGLSSPDPDNKGTSDKPPKSTSRARAIASSGKQVLQSRTVNQMDSPATARLNNLTNITASCSAAVTFLETVESGDGVPELQPLQVENARYSLTIKLTQLEMYDLALKELRILKRRLETIMQRSTGKESWFVEAKEEEAPSKLSKLKSKAHLKSTPSEDQKKSKVSEDTDMDIAKLLEFSHVTPTSNAFPMLVAYQIGILRCVIGLKKPSLLELIAPSLSSANNPISLIKQLARSSTPKALGHIVALIQLMNSAMPSTSVNADTTAMDQKSFCSPKTALTLQLIAIECAVLRKAMRSDDSDKPRSKDQWSTFAASLNAYIRRTRHQKSKRERYILVRDLVEKARRLLDGKDSTASLPIDIYKLLSWVSSDSGLVKESMKWTDEWARQLQEADDPDNAALLVLCKVRLTIMEFRLSGEHVNTTPETIKKLQDRANETAEGLTNVSRGRKQDLELLLQEVGYLRRSSLFILSSILTELAVQDDSSRIEEYAAKLQLKHVCDSIVGNIILFCKKYMAMGMSESERSRLISISVPTIDTALSTCWRAFDAGSQDSWNNAEVLLRDCTGLVRAMEKEGFEGLDKEFYEKLSSSYWQIHLLYRKRPGEDSQSILALRKSIAALDGRSAGEHANAFIALKWERLGGMFCTIGDYRKAEDAFLHAMDSFAEIGFLETVGSRATGGEPLSCIIEATDRNTKSVARVITGLVRIATKKNDEVAAELRFKNEGLSVAARGILLEWALGLAVDIAGEGGCTIRVVAERLLDLYDLDEMPIRRARVVGKVLGISVDRPGLVNEEEVRLLGQEVAEWAAHATSSMTAEDEGLKPIKDDVLASCSVSLAFCYWQDEKPRRDYIEKGLGFWNSIVTKEDNWAAILRRVENVEDIQRKLKMAAEFCEMKGEDTLRIQCLNLALTFRELERPINYEATVRLHCTIGLQYVRLGYTGRAGMALGKAQVLLKKGENAITTATKLQWHLAYTEYLIGVGNPDKCLDHFQLGREILEHDEELRMAKESGAKIAKRVGVNRVIADAAYAVSLLSFEKGNINDSLMNARRSVRLNQRAWAGLEAISKEIPRSGYSKVSQAPVNSLAESLGSLSLSGTLKPKIHSTTFSALNTPSLWTLVPALYSGLMQTANIYSHLGMVREALFFAEQALEIVAAVNAGSVVTRTKIMIADLKIRSNEVTEGERILCAVREAALGERTVIDLNIALGNLERVRGNFEAEMTAYSRAEEGIDLLLHLAKDDKERDVVVELANEIATLELDAPKPKQKAKAPVRSGTKQAALKSAVAKLSPKKPVSKAAAISGECATLLKRKGQIRRLRAYSLAVHNECIEAQKLIDESAKLPVGHHEVITQGLVNAKQLFHEALSLVSSDPVFSVLQDSTISLPSIAISNALGQLSPVKKGSRKQTTSGAKQARAFVEILERARDCIFSVHSRAMDTGSSVVARRVASLLTGIIVLLSAMKNDRGKGPEHPLFASYSLELNKGLPLERERLVVRTEKMLSNAKDDLSWPRSLESNELTLTLPFDFSTFQSEYIDIIPKQWAAVSISLSENCEELYISRFQAGHSQLMVRLPLTRHNSRDDINEVFEYHNGIEELKEIIDEANTSTHAANSMKNKEARAKWWKEREELDDRLKELLMNIEHIWLGGFKGILSQYPRYPSLFARFKASFDKILAKYLPSRSKKTTKGRVNIDYRVLELFISLGDPEGQELEDELMDLIYFVVDILQFHGEGNAYDEIDTDSMVIEMTEALMSYHEAAGWHPETAELEVDHTILILDKSVQMFPWESMPCLRGQSISRLPSMTSLRDRILRMQETRAYQPRPGHYMDHKSGGYILNPGSDLQSTQKTFESRLKGLSGDWEGIVNRTPTESEFAQKLEHKDVFLYFGHGSGAHYLPAKYIRRLEKCAVACLMGCSSGSLKDTGEFEPYGPPTNYLLAECPAVLATLWDVTDKDIDRFALDAFESWGLFTTKASSRSKEKKKVESGKSLVEAVAGARDKCVMKYLNGAAPVVYGIPAYFA